jgi:hypothetical protein
MPALPSWKTAVPTAAFAFFVIATPIPASAQAPAAPAPAARVVNNQRDSGYQVWFPVDQLGGGGMSPGGDIVRAGYHAMRPVLMRPRLQFVPELLKSVEAL